MTDDRPDPRRPIDPAINSPGREGLTGTAPASLYAPGLEREQVTIAPDFAPALIYLVHPALDDLVAERNPRYFENLNDRNVIGRGRRWLRERDWCRAQGCRALRRRRQLSHGLDGRPRVVPQEVTRTARLAGSWPVTSQSR